MNFNIKILKFVIMNNTIAAGRNSLGLRADCKIIGWGKNGHGQINCPEESFIAISAGFCHSLGLRADGKVIGWGKNVYGQINCPDELFIAIAAGDFHSLGLRSDGKVIR